MQLHVINLLKFQELHHTLTTFFITINTLTQGNTMKLKSISIAIIACGLPTTSLFAAALERSNQSIQAFLEPDNYAEVGFKVVDHHTTAKLTNNNTAFVGRASTATRNSLIDKNIGDITPTYLVPNIAIKTQINDKLSLGFIYDEPFGLDTKFNMNSAYFSSFGNIVNGHSSLNPESQGNDATRIQLDTKNITLPIGYHLNNNSTLIAAPVFQHLNGSLNIYGTHMQTSGANFYKYFQTKFKSDDAYGWLLAYSYQNNNLKAAITYRSEIKHKFNTTHNLVSALIPYTNNKNSITTPQSVNLDLSNKITQNTTTTANVRWVNWKNFEMRIDPYRVFTSSTNHPSQNNNANATRNLNAIQYQGYAGGLTPISYNKDQWSIDLGLQQKLTDKWEVNGGLGWDSGVGKYVSHYTPASESWSATIGLKYSPTSKYFIQTGFSYIWYEDIKGQHAKQQAINSAQNDVNFIDSYALNYDFKIGYKF
jgi:long-chain fatty acid transport protein